MSRKRLRSFSESEEETPTLRWDITNALFKLASMNSQLHAYCPFLSMHMFHGMGVIRGFHNTIDTRIVISLRYQSSDYNNGRPQEVSTISIQDNFTNFLKVGDENDMVAEMNSETHPPFQKRGYNLLLRIVATILAPLCMFQGRPITKLFSNAANTVSAYILMNKLGYSICAKTNDYNYITDPDEFSLQRLIETRKLILLVCLDVSKPENIAPIEQTFIKLLSEGSKVLMCNMNTKATSENHSTSSVQKGGKQCDVCSKVKQQNTRRAKQIRRKHTVRNRKKH